MTGIKYDRKGEAVVTSPHIARKLLKRLLAEKVRKQQTRKESRSELEKWK